MGNRGSRASRSSSAGRPSLGSGDSSCDDTFDVNDRVTSARLLAARLPEYALDLGGTLVKLVCVREDHDDSSETRGRMNSTPNLSVDFEEATTEVDFGPCNSLHFYRFDDVEKCIEFLEAERASPRSGRWTSPASDPSEGIPATGGGAYKHAELFRERLDLTVTKLAEMETLICGLNYLLTHPMEVFTYDCEADAPVFQPATEEASKYPYLLVNIGTGTSILKVTGPESFTRVGGSTLGGGTYLGLSKLLTRLSSFDEIHELEKDGRESAVDLLVGDIYGAGEHLHGLRSTAIASSFGKVPRATDQFAPEDLTRSLLVMLCNTLSQVAFLTMRVENVERVYFSGGFLREKAYVWSKLSWGMDYWSKGATQARFLRHDGFLGAVGALLANQAPDELPRERRSRKSSSSRSPTSGS